jgi:hypothetical protein
MAYAPATPFPKGRGDSIRSADWNEAMNELIRLETAKFDKTGGTVSGNLTVTGTISGTLANNIVTTAKIADGNVTSQKLAAGGISGDRLANASVGTVKLDAIEVYNGSISIGANSTYLIGFVGEFLDSNPRFFQLLVFSHGTVHDSYVTWDLRYYTYDSGGGRLFSTPYLQFTNLRAAVTQVHCRVWALRGPA